MNLEELNDKLNGNPDGSWKAKNLKLLKDELESTKTESNILGRKNSDIGFKKWGERRSNSTGKEAVELLLNQEKQKPLKDRIKELEKMINVLNDYQPPKQLEIGEKMFIEEINNQMSSIVEDYYMSDKYPNHIQFEPDTDSFGFPRKIYKTEQEAIEAYKLKVEGRNKAEETNLKTIGKRGIQLRNLPIVIQNPFGSGYVIITAGLAKKNNLEHLEIYPVNHTNLNDITEQLQSFLEEDDDEVELSKEAKAVAKFLELDEDEVEDIEMSNYEMFSDYLHKVSAHTSDGEKIYLVSCDDDDIHSAVESAMENLFYGLTVEEFCKNVTPYLGEVNEFITDYYYDGDAEEAYENGAYNGLWGHKFQGEVDYELLADRVISNYGAGHELNTYDNSTETVEYDGNTYYLFRQQV